MAFHFQPQADSSDQEQVDISAWQSRAKPMRKSPALPAPVAPMTAHGDEEDSDSIEMPSFQTTAAANGAGATGFGAEEDVDEEAQEEDGVQILEGDIHQDEPDGVVAIKDSQTPAVESAREQSTGRKSTRQNDVFVSPGFTSINQPIPRTSDSSDDELSAPTREVSSRTRQTSRDSNGAGARILVPILPRVDVDDGEILDFTKGGDIVRRVKKELKRRGDLSYVVEFEDRHVEEVCYAVPQHPCHCTPSITCLGHVSFDSCLRRPHLLCCYILAFRSNADLFPVSVVAETSYAAIAVVLKIESASHTCTNQTSQ